jgi:apolipoprotein D and lipocalin family protein
MSRASPLLTMLWGAVFVTAGCLADPPLDTAPNVDLTRFQGKWYEIASLPRDTQANCYGTTAFYSRMSDGAFEFVHQCNVDSTGGWLKTVTMTATVPDQSNPAQLALDVGGFTGAYWILEVGPNYEYAVVGHPSRSFLWILSRTPTLDTATTHAILDRAQGNRFDTSKLQYTPQPPPGERLSSNAPVGAVPSAPGHTGCSASGSTAKETPVLCFGLVATAFAFRRTRKAAR